jgi:hypothetical protein
MERQSKNTRSVGEGDGEGGDARTKARDLMLSDLQDEIKNLTAALKDVRDVLKTINEKNNRKIPGVE